MFKNLLFKKYYVKFHFGTILKQITYLVVKNRKKTYIITII